MTNYEKAKPKPHLAKMHPTLQQYDSPVQDVSKLRASLRPLLADPVSNWSDPESLVAGNTTNNDSDEIDCCNITSWFPKDDNVVFYTPKLTNNNNKDKVEKPEVQQEQLANQKRYDTLTYKQLHEQILECPPYLMSSELAPSCPENITIASSNKAPVVAVILPTHFMAEMAVAIIATIATGAVAAPIDPRTPTLRILEAMEQLQCTHLVSTTEILMEMRLLKKQKICNELDDNSDTCLGQNISTDPDYLNPDKESEIRIFLSSFLSRTIDIRLIDKDVDSGGCGRIKWNILQRGSSSILGKNKGDLAVFRWHRMNQKEQQEMVLNSVRRIRTESQPAILLRTSGTTSSPKIVPISAPMLLFGSLCIASSLKLSRDDICCNAMPFYHIGGISCNLISVLASGSAVIHSGHFKDPGAFLEHLLLPIDRTDDVSATWYYAAPSMHKAVLITAESRLYDNNNNDGNDKKHMDALPNKLRFIRNAAAHLNHNTILRLSKVFDTHIVPTYGMSEAMPICSSIPIHHQDESFIIDSVGYPIGNSIRIIDETGMVLSHGSNETDDRAVGEISVCGAGVIDEYIGLDVRVTHTCDGWLKTGDVGYLDCEGRLFIKGRTKEMIKRGGEQIWPNQIDGVVEKVPGVATAVAFGVPNELWGEEAAVAVILAEVSAKVTHDHDAYLKSMEEQIMLACREQLEDAAVPRQIKFLKSQDQLLRGPTNKYIRSGMASHLKVTARDTGALRALQAMENMNNGETTPPLPPTSSHRRILPSEAINGLRLFTAFFVLQHHVGLYPNIAWLKLSNFSFNMTIFFTLGAFQVTCAVASSVRNQWASFVGTKIGTMHALFVITQFISLPAWYIWKCNNGGFFEGDEEPRCPNNILFAAMRKFFLATFIGITANQDEVGLVTWFQAAFYWFLILFPFLDHYLRRQSTKVSSALLVIFTLTACGISTVCFSYMNVPSYWYYTILNWLPTILSAMSMAYLFRSLMEHYHRKHLEEESNKTQPSEKVDKKVSDTIHADDLKKYTKVWGTVTDCMSLLLLVTATIVATSDNCLCVRIPTFQEMRPDIDLSNTEVCPFDSKYAPDYVKTCSITHSEFANYIQEDPKDKLNWGRWETEGFIKYMGLFRLGTPLILLWIFSMSFGNGITARLMGCKFMSKISTLAYPVYLLHLPISRYYWYATRDIGPKFWWGRGLHPDPVAWYEVLFILALTMISGGLIDRLLVPFVMPYSITLGVGVTSRISSFIRYVINRCTCGAFHDNIDSKSQLSTSTYEQVQGMVMGLTGSTVTRDMKLQYLGLDSLGAIALLGMLRANVTSAKSLTMQQLSKCDTIGELVDCLDGDITYNREFSDEDIDQSDSMV